MRISDWSSDVCSSDLTRFAHPGRTYKWGASRVGIGGVTDCSNLITSPDPTLSSAHSQMRAAAATWARMPHKTDASGIHRLISECPPLDLNSVYTYLLLSEHFSRTRSEEHTSALQSLMRISSAGFSFKKKT